ncbi:hypothetical protein [Devosia sp.]|uniref:hypothetical protein n=1 Tax=Devosia sp. TaxID=1871048 RepID=UPI0032646C8D
MATLQQPNLAFRVFYAASYRLAAFFYANFVGIGEALKRAAARSPLRYLAGVSRASSKIETIGLVYPAAQSRHALSARFDRFVPRSTPGGADGYVVVEVV